MDAASGATGWTRGSRPSARCSRFSRATGRRPSRTGVAGGPTLFLALLLEGFYIAPRGMGAIPAIATETDIDDLVGAIGRALGTLARVGEAAAAAVR